MAQKGNEIHTGVHHKDLLSDIVEGDRVCPANMDGEGREMGVLLLAIDTEDLLHNQEIQLAGVAASFVCE